MRYSSLAHRVDRLVMLLALLLVVPGFLVAQGPPKDDRVTAYDIKLHSGITLNYVVQGNSNGPVIVLLHGAGDSWHSYQRVLPLLPETYRVYAVTLRGHGLSDHPEEGYSRNDFAADILDLLGELKLQHVTLVGHSLGSFVAQKVAEQDQAGRLSRLVLIGSGPGVSKAGSSEHEISGPFASLKDPIPYTFARDFQASTIYHPVPAWFFEMMVGESQRVPAATWHGLAQTIAGGSSIDDLKKIKVPTLLLWGEKDSIFHREDQQALLDTIPHATLKSYPETGHALHWERPEEFTRDLLAFIDGSGAKPR
ncbi:MAG: alpha/beta hydrolase [Edaphobacter sp.]|uniref:alpha/beta fold hydrolase n=1 Tax=Edaphobacter sp. TaxID=1934404 RepID=UPI002397D167|nr:alpha/beta hydrolase [Edaphobacter sp.]MDE1175613.1 alpha/beta hydrolase [Edaphobacter sp.]